MSTREEGAPGPVAVPVVPVTPTDAPRRVSPTRVVAIESACAALLIAGGVYWAAPGDLALRDVGFHPAWIPIIVLAARYGLSGLFTSIAMTWGALVGATLLQGQSLAGFHDRLRGALDLFVLATAILVAWIAILHGSRMARSLGRLSESLELQRQSDETVQALYDSLVYLRSRHDRIDMSLGLWRDLAGRLERGDAREAARAALELCAIRAGAAAGVIQMTDGTAWHTLAWRGAWSSSTTKPRDLMRDRTVQVAIASRRVLPASEVTGACGEESDVAVPILAEGTNQVLGVIALRGVSPGRLRAADMGDLVVIAQWLAPALSLAIWAAQPREDAAAGVG